MRGGGCRGRAFGATALPAGRPHKARPALPRLSIERFAHAVVGRAVQFNARGEQPPQGIRERSPRRIKNRDMIQTRRAWRRRRKAKSAHQPGKRSVLFRPIFNFLWKW